MRNELATASLLALLLTFTPALHAAKLPAPSDEMMQAVGLANALLPTLERNPKQLKLVKVENLVWRGDPAIWRLTYKHRSLIRGNKDGPVGTGGELFIEVDLHQKRARFLGAGE